jgi:sporulation protein YlmC with PRC-barrel domain
MNVSELKRTQPVLAGIAAAIALALGSGLQAQQPSQQPRTEQQQPQQQPRAQQPQSQSQSQQPRTQADQQIARSDTGTQTLDQYLQSKTLRVSKVDGMELQTRNGDNLGEVEDVMRGASPSQMMLLVKIGGVGADSKLIAVPFNEVQINSKGDELYTTRTREQLASAPAVQANAPSTAAGANRDAADRGGAAQPPAAGGAPGQRGATASTAPNQQRLAALVGADVVGSGDDKVGEVDDIVISTAGADGTRAVLQVGGVAGIGQKRISVPLSQLTVERAGNDNEPTLHVAMDTDALQRLPEYKYDDQTSL